ncbi:PqqD family peptide modification chaperone [Streptomyces sp. NPDC004542]|uniref:PqqD family peptide modification chaperone n=1 Tax=Streptomyces sp. NPDC004542 TaxID=3154281 RepID=UPI0033B7565A
MRVQPVPGVSVNVDADGYLEVVAEPSGPAGRFRCGPVGTAMWIALRQHDGDVAAAADLLSALWCTDPANTRADLDIWIEELRDAGLVRTAPCGACP